MLGEPPWLLGLECVRKPGPHDQDVVASGGNVIVELDEGRTKTPLETIPHNGAADLSRDRDSEPRVLVGNVAGLLARE